MPSRHCSAPCTSRRRSRQAGPAGTRAHELPTLDRLSLVRLRGCREAWVLLALAHFLLHAAADGSDLAGSARLIANAMSAAEGHPEELALLRLAQCECHLRNSSVADARATLRTADALAKGDSQPLLLGLVARMGARCDAVEHGPAAAVQAYTAAASLLEQDGMLGGWRELGGLLRMGGAQEAGELALRWSIGRAPRRSEQQALGGFHLAAHFVATGDMQQAKEVAKTLRKVAPTSIAAKELQATVAAGLGEKEEPGLDDKTGKRIDASDGQAYNYASFVECYGANADEFWARAAVAP